MRVLERQPEQLGATRYKHQVDVVRHETVPHHCHIVQRKTLIQQIKIDVAIRIAVENKSAPISALGDVVVSIDCDHTRQTSHGSIRIAVICRIWTLGLPPYRRACRSPSGHAHCTEVVPSAMHTIASRPPPHG
jgi:hypothetical protein